MLGGGLCFGRCIVSHLFSREIPHTGLPLFFALFLTKKGGDEKIGHFMRWTNGSILERVSIMGGM